MSVKLNDGVIIKLYVDEGLSVKHIAEKLGTYPNKVRRQLQKLGIELRNQSDAQREALLNGRSTHPTKGKKREEDVKRKISQSTADFWKNVTDDEKEERCRNLKEYWGTLSQHEKDQINKMSAKGRLTASRFGSKFERFLGRYLQNEGYNVIVHKKGTVINDNLELDILIPELKTVIEVDGPGHHIPIYGEDRLVKQQQSDNEKNGLLLSEGFVVIRFKHMSKNLTKKYQYDSAQIILSKLKEIEAQFPPVGKRLIYL